MDSLQAGRCVRTRNTAQSLGPFENERSGRTNATSAQARIRFLSTSRFTRNRARRNVGARRIDSRHTHVAVEHVVRACSRLVPDVDTGTIRNGNGELYRRIADCDVASDSGVRRRGEYHDAVRIANGRVFFDEVVVTRKDTDAEVVVGSRVAISARLVPPERVIASLDSYASAGESWFGGTVPHCDIGSDAYSRRRGIDPNPGLAVGRGGNPFDFTEQGSGEEDAGGPETLHHSRPPDLYIGLAIGADPKLVCYPRTTAAGCWIGLSGDGEAVEPQVDV